MKTLKKIFEAILVSCGYHEKEIPKETAGERPFPSPPPPAPKRRLSEDIKMPKCKPPRKKAALDEIRDELEGIKKQLEIMNETKVGINPSTDEEKGMKQLFSAGKPINELAKTYTYF